MRARTAVATLSVALIAAIAGCSSDETESGGDNDATTNTAAGQTDTGSDTDTQTETETETKTETETAAPSTYAEAITAHCAASNQLASGLNDIFGTDEDTLAQVEELYAEWEVEAQSFGEAAATEYGDDAQAQDSDELYKDTLGLQDVFAESTANATQGADDPNFLKEGTATQDIVENVANVRDECLLLNENIDGMDDLVLTWVAEQ